MIEKNSYSAKDVLVFPRIGQVLASPDSKQVAFITYQVHFTPRNKEWRYSLFLKNQLGKINLLVKDKEISLLNWSPNGKQIAYSANGKKHLSIWVYDIQTHKTNKLIEYSSDITSFRWSPNGKYIAFTAGDEKKMQSSFTPLDISKDYTNTCLYLFSIRSGVVKPLTSANYSVSQFFVNPDFDWSPDSRSITFAYQPRAGDAYFLENKIGIIDLKTLKVKTVPYTKTHNSTQPVNSPDGKWIAFQASPSRNEIEKKLGSLDPTKPSPILLMIASVNHICLANTTTLETHCLPNTPNESPVLIGWNASSKQIFAFDPFHKTDGPKIYALNLNPTIPVKLLSNVNGFIEPFTISFNNSHQLFGFGYETVSNAPQAYISSTDTFKLEQISHLPTTSKILGKVETIHWKSKDGMTIEGLLIKPAHYNPNKKYPLLVGIHGGPIQAWSKRYLGGCDQYEEMIDPTTCYSSLLGLGFIILQPNPRGSDGYGASFRLANFADFGGGDYQDVISGIDYLIQHNIADPDHLAIAGWSYGGYLTAWAISQTNRFKAAVEGDGNTDFISFAGTSDALLFTPSFLGNNFWDDNSLYLQRSPIFHTKKITTPLLILQGENDIRVPPTQSFELYYALERQHKIVKMLLFPHQGHEPTDANIIYKSINEVKDWLKKAL